jgi:hypothetical protein
MRTLHLAIVLFSASLPLLADSLDTWFVRSTNAFTSVAYAGDRFYALAENGIYPSADGSIWPAKPVSPSAFTDLTDGNGILVAVGGRSVATSLDGNTWILRTLGTTLNLSSVAFGNGIFVAVGEAGTAWVSEDGINWQPHATGAPAILNKIKFRAGVFKAVGANGSIVSSKDAVSWTLQESVQNLMLWDVECSGERWIAVGEVGRLLYAVDESWAVVRFNDSNYFRAAAFAGRTFVVAGLKTSVWTSIDGINYTGRTPLSDLRLLWICFGQGTFVAAGPEGIVQSAKLQAVAEPTPGRLATDLYPALTVAGQTGFTYRIEATTDAADPATWLKVGTITLREPSQLWWDVSAPRNNQRFYRAVLEQEP